MGAELMCLALTVYFEARGETEAGQVAVAQTVMQRVEDGGFPDTICEVVWQGGEILNSCHFSWYCDGKSDRPSEPAAWAAAYGVAERVINGTRIPRLEGVLWYHADYVDPSWARVLHYRVTIGNHLFYGRDSDNRIDNSREHLAVEARMGTCPRALRRERPQPSGGSMASLD